MKLKNLIPALIALVLFSSCKTQYETVLSSNDADAKYDLAFQLFNEGK